MSFRKLIEQAMLETSADFSKIIEGKLMALLGAGEPAPAPKQTTAKRTSSTTAAPAKRGPGRPKGSKSKPKTPVPTKKTASPKKKTAESKAKKKPAPKATLVPKSELEASILKALSTSSMMKSPLMKAAGISKNQDRQVKEVLKELRAQSKITMSGQKNKAVYSVASVKADGGGDALLSA